MHAKTIGFKQELLNKIAIYNRSRLGHTMRIKICSNCNIQFQCEENSSCWFFKLSHVYLNNDKEQPKDCICPRV